MKQVGANPDDFKSEQEAVNTELVDRETADDGGYVISPLPRAVAMGRIAARSILETLK